MPIQTAQSTITTAVTGGNTEWTLVDVQDNAVTYRATTVAGQALTALAEQPVMRITRRPSSPKVKAVKYNVKVTAHVLDGTNGAVVGSYIDDRNIVISDLYYSAATTREPSQLVKSSGLVLNGTELQAILTDGAFMR